MKQSASSSSIDIRFLYILVFFSGMTTLVVEISASQLLGFIFGTSNIVWANVIGLMLVYLTVGYFIGGRIADRNPYPGILFRLVLWGSFLSVMAALIARPILQIAGRAVVDLEAGLVVGSFVSVLVLFSIPVTLLGTVSPFAIRLAMHDVENAGRVSGQIYAISTIGSILGTFLPVLVTIPRFGTLQTFLLFGSTLFLVALIGLWLAEGRRALRNLWMLALMLIGGIVVLNGPLRPPSDDLRLLYEDESAYNYIQVQEDPNGYRYLFLNEGQGIHSQWHPQHYYYRRTWDYFLAAPYFSPDFQPDDMQSLLVIGLAAGTIPRQTIEVYGDIPIDGVEIDPAIIEAGERYFGMNASAMPSLNAIAQDGRFALKQLQDQRYTVIAIDAYRPPYIPWHLTTIEYFEEVRALLADDGVLAINVGRTSTDRRLVDALSNTLAYVFPAIHAIDVPYSFNTILVATQMPTQATDLVSNAAALPDNAHPLLRQVLQDTQESLVPVAFNNTVFTDNHAPVEALIDSLVLNFLIEGGAEELR